MVGIAGIAASVYFFSVLTKPGMAWEHFSAQRLEEAQVAGHLASDLVRYWATKGPAAGWIGKALYLVVPNLEALNLKEAMVYKDALPAGTTATAFLYGVLYAAGVVAVAAAIFSRRDLR